LGKTQLHIPKRPSVATEAIPHVSVYILPDCKGAGMLETLCLQSVAKDAVLPCVDEYLDCIQTGGNLPGNLDKARLHAFLASRPKPDLQLGEAASAGYWPWDHPAFERLKEFLLAL